MNGHPRLENPLLRFEELQECGTPVRAEDLCVDCPELPPELRRRIEALASMDARLETKPARSPEQTESIGKQVGPYVLIEWMGEGGMGEVWVAKQIEPVKRKVALKLIKPGMDSKVVLARFEQERQALGLMDHPNIARVFDDGLTTDSAGTRKPARH
jgi:serine/threonine-protein kinase